VATWPMNVFGVVVLLIIIMSVGRPWCVKLFGFIRFGVFPQKLAAGSYLAFIASGGRNDTHSRELRVVRTSIMPTPSTTAAVVRRRRRNVHFVALSTSALLTFAVAGNSLSLGKPSSPTAARPGRRGVVRHATPNLPSDILGDHPHPPSDARGSAPSWPLFDRDLSVPAVLLAGFLNLLGFTMTSPIQPALGRHFSLPIGASFGSLSSAYPLGMMLGILLWPSLSDVLGRKIVLSLTLAGSGLGLMLQSWGIRRCWTLEQFLAARVLTGCFAGNGPISKAYLADRGSEGNRRDLSKYLAWKDASSTLAFIVGPALGGLVYQIFGGSGVVDESNRISIVILFSAMASLFAAVSVSLFVNNKGSGDKLAKASALSADKKHAEDLAMDEEKIVSCPLGSKLWTGVASVACVSALYHAADSTFFAFFPSLLQNRLNFDTQAVGMAFTSFAVVSFTMSAFVSSRFMKAFGPVAACTAGLGAVGTGLWTLGYAASLPAGMSMGITTALILGASALYYVGVPLYGPSVPSMLLQCVPSHKRGAVMGFDGAVNTVARIVSPLIIGEIHRVKGAGACFKVAGACAYAAVSVALLRRWLVMRKLFGKSANADAE
jgi:DHA1 family tetracycline resistance protein-like MFS transporter